MRRSHIRVYVHFVWATWDRRPLIGREWKGRLYAVMTAECEKSGCEVRRVNGMDDHVHMVTAIPATVTLAQIAHDVKGVSSRWINEHIDLEEQFQWQGRYAAFSVRPQDLPRVNAYVRDQEKHHADGTLWPNAEDF